MTYSRAARWSLILLFLLPSTADAEPRLKPISSWAYQLQGAGNASHFHKLCKSNFDLLVVDYADGGNPLTKQQVNKLRKKGKRKVVAYLSVGEAENYRFYWKPAWRKKPPLFLAARNPEWRGNYKVRYWSPKWQRLLFGVAKGPDKSYVDRVLDAGFDGVYLDIIDAFEFFGPEGERPERPTAAKDMAELVVRLATYIREKRGEKGFLIIPQNGSNLLDEVDEKTASQYLSTVDAIGAEDTFYFGDKEEDNPLDVQKDTVEALQRFHKAGKPVLAVDYLTDKKKAKRFVSMARQQGFIPYVGRRALDRLVPQPAAGATSR